MYSLGEAIIAFCNAAFGLHNLGKAALSGTAIETISTEQLRAARDANDPMIVLVDVRSEAERSVSMIPGAITAGTFEADLTSYEGKIIVPYCTIGGRSYLYARKLSAAGISTRNYRDSILGWCRSGLALEAPDGQPTKSVHPYWPIFRVPDDYEVRT